MSDDCFHFFFYLFINLSQGLNIPGRPVILRLTPQAEITGLYTHKHCQTTRKYLAVSGQSLYSYFIVTTTRYTHIFRNCIMTNRTRAITATFIWLTDCAKRPQSFDIGRVWSHGYIPVVRDPEMSLFITILYILVFSKVGSITGTMNGQLMCITHGYFHTRKNILLRRNKQKPFRWHLSLLYAFNCDFDLFIVFRHIVRTYPMLFVLRRSCCEAFLFVLFYET